MKHILSFLLLVSFFASLRAAVVLQSEGGWLESCYVTWTPVDGATGYNVYYKPQGAAQYQQIDAPLVRQYPDYYRADMVGIPVGQYQMKVVPVFADGANEAESAESGLLEVKAHDRSGYAHFKTVGTTTFKPANGIGAYANDGTLKSGARVLYVHAGNAKTISCEVITASNGSKTTAVGLQSIIAQYEKGYDKTPLDIRIIGTLTPSDIDYFASSAEGIQIKGRNVYSEMNITIEGIGDDATIHGFGFLIRNAVSVELRNFAIMWCMDDGVSMDTGNSNLWIHNLDLFYGQRGSDADQAKGDGTLDLKGNTCYTTIAYNHLWDTGKSSLCGMKSETGPNYITYHHNWFDHSDSRHPRIRTMSVHIYNNYYDGNAKYGVGVTMGANAFVERNYFRNCKYPMLISLQGCDIHNGVGTSDETKGTFSGEDGGIIKAWDNYMTGQLGFQPYDAAHTTYSKHFDAYVAAQRTEQVPASVQSLQGGHSYSNFDTDPSTMYQQYICDEASQIPAIVTGVYGAGRCQHGDFTWTFGADEDSNYEVIDPLSAAVHAYQPTLVRICEANHSSADDEDEDDGDDDDDTPLPPFAEDVLCHFSDKVPSSSMVSVSGNYSNSHGSLTYRGTTYPICVKMESATEILIKPTADCTVTLQFGGDANAANTRIKLDNVTQNIDANGRYTFSAKAGKTYSLKKGDTLYLFLILFAKDTNGLSPIEIADTAAPIYNLQGQPVRHTSPRHIYIQNGRKVIR